MKPTFSSNGFPKLRIVIIFSNSDVTNYYKYALYTSKIT